MQVNAQLHVVAVVAAPTADVNFSSKLSNAPCWMHKTAGHLQQ
jgi:hypothetical protein